MKKIWTEKALSDIENIQEYYFEKSPKGALKLINDIFEVVEKMKFPLQYQVYEYNPIFRKISIRGYLILYQVSGDYLYFVRVINGKQNLVIKSETPD